MKTDQRYLWLMFVLFPFLFWSTAFPQSLVLSNHDSGDSDKITWSSTESATTGVLGAERGGQTSTQTSAQPSRAPESPAERPFEWGIAIYPGMVWAPVFGASVTLPPLPSQPIAPGPSGSTDASLNAAYFGGARIEKGKWSADLLFMWAALSAHRETPLTKVDLDLVFGDAMAGRELLPGFYIEGGVRRLSTDIHATVESSSASRSPGFWDPLIGMTYSRQVGKKWRILVHGDGGGFGVGSDVDVSATARAEWQFVRHFGVTAGYGGVHLNESNSVAGKRLTISPTLHGPIFGLGVYF